MKHEPFDKIQKIKNFWSADQCQSVVTYLKTCAELNYLAVGDSQAPNSFVFSNHYYLNGLAYLSTPKMSQAAGRDLFPTYTYGRVYLQPDELVPHIDREACEISATITLDYEKSSDEEIWPIHIKKKNKKISCSLDRGDALLYAGCMYEHWRDQLAYESHTQLFIHYVDKNGPFYKNLIKERPYLKNLNMFDVNEPPSASEAQRQSHMTKEMAELVSTREGLWRHQGKTLPS